MSEILAEFHLLRPVILNSIQNIDLSDGAFKIRLESPGLSSPNDILNQVQDDSLCNLVTNVLNVPTLLEGPSVDGLRMGTFQSYSSFIHPRSTIALRKR